MCLSKIINIADVCISLSYWPNYFKVSTTVIIPKPNKSSYDSLKVFRPIVLLNTLGKLIKKVIAERLQFIVVSNNFIHPSQLRGLKSKSTINAGVALTHIVWSGWTKGRNTSTLAFDIAQFFPSLNHHFLILVLEKAGLDSKVSNFFASYLIQRSTKYSWNNLSSPSFDINVGVGQGSTLSPILSTLYISPVMGHWMLTIFYFILFYFFWFYFSFSLFYFPGKMMKKARDKEVTWHITWCDVTSLEHDGRV